MEKEAVSGEIMSQLFDKARALLDRVMFKRADDRLKELEDFIKNEIKPEILEVRFSSRDLMEIHGKAAQIATSTSYGEEVNGKRIFSDPSLLQAYCYFQAVHAQLRARGLLIHDIKLGDQKDENRKGQI